MAEYYADCAAGTLPNITFVDPPFRDGGGGDGISADEHPLGDVRLGQAFMSDVVHAFIESPNWERGALFIVYDEWGGFFDHVRPPSVPDARRSSNIDDDFGLMGFRIPAVAVSPFATARRGQPSAVRVRVDHQPDHLPLRARPPHDPRRAGAEHRQQHELDQARTSSGPDLPDPDRIVSAPCTLGGGDVLDGQQTPRERSRRARGPRRPLRHPDRYRRADQIFREPDSLQKALG